MIDRRTYEDLCPGQEIDLEPDWLGRRDFFFAWKYQSIDILSRPSFDCINFISIFLVITLFY
jgi:hypothetical protein